MGTLTIRVINWLRERRSDRGAVTSEYLMWSAVAAGMIGLIAVPRMEGIINGVLDAMDAALPG